MPRTLSDLLQEVRFLLTMAELLAKDSPRESRRVLAMLAELVRSR